MTRRERVLNSIEFKPVDKLPKDLGGMPSTGISCFAMTPLRNALNLPYKLPRVYDINQMLALPETDLLDALDCDVVTVCLDEFTNAFDEPKFWSNYNFNGRLNSLVKDPSVFSVDNQGYIYHKRGWVEGVTYFMPTTGFVFDEKPSGKDNSNLEIVKHDLHELEKSLKKKVFTAEKIKSITQYLRRVRESSDRAVFLNGLSTNIGFHIGIPEWSMLCLLEPEYIHAYQRILIDHFKENARNLLPEIKNFIDINMTAADDHGTQDSTILPEDSFRELYVPYFREANTLINELAPNVKNFIHSCGAIYPIIDDIIECKFDILNPVQWSAGKHTYKEWKDKCRNRIALWGGGIDTQHVLPQGSINEIQKQASEVCSYLSTDTGFVFNPIHNILAGIAPEKVIAIYKAADSF